MEKKRIGRVTHFFDKICVAVIEIEKELKIGDSISIEGSTTQIQQKVDSMQIENQKISIAKKGQAVGMKVKERTRINDIVYKV